MNSKYIRYTVMLFLLSVLGGRAQDDPLSMRLRRENPDKVKPHRFDEIMKIVEKSRICYQFHDTDEVYSEIIDKDAKNDRALLPESYALRIKKDGSRTLIVDRPSSLLATEYGQAQRAIKSGDFDNAIKIYKEAIRLEPDYYKTYTLLGNVFFMKEDYVNAEKNLLKAISLNELDYQAYFFLGDTYFWLGDHERAKRYLTIAFMFNKNNSLIRMGLQKVFEKFKLRIRENRLTIPGKFEIINDSLVKIFLNREGGRNWVSMLINLTCWHVEPSFRKLLEHDSLKLTMYKECLMNQACATAVNIKDSLKISLTEECLYKAMLDGYQNA
ncbi:tetratricopeptide repeat protein, partial [Candidatus Bathyarchaeota archaeon]|nr:tetratricopeptide repeat protein [Candidatus Bathyarchaeota archaeon]